MAKYLEVMYNKVYLCVTKQINTMTQTTPSKRITKTTAKAFIARHGKADNLWLMLKSDFSGYADCIEAVKNPTFAKTTFDAEKASNYNTLGVVDAWFVGNSRDYFEPFESDEFSGISVWNSCGSFVLAFKK